MSKSRRQRRSPRANNPGVAGAKHEEKERGLRERFWVAGGAVILMLFYVHQIGRFFPNPRGCLGSDYSYFLPNLLDGYYWFHSNGLFEVPWFTPSFCGGSLVFPNLQRSFYSFPQFLTFLVEPLTAIITTVYVFAFAGGAGFYLLLRRSFLVSRWAALLGGGLFLFNGFYSHRMIIGHFGYHTFMLLPLLAYFLLRRLPDGSASSRVWRLLFDGSVAGVFLALMAGSDFVTLLIPGLLSVVIIGLVHGLSHGQQRAFWMRLSLACLLGVLLSLAKLTGIVAFMDHAPRSDYLLPGADSLLHSFGLAARCLFFGAEIDPSRSQWVKNAQWLLAQHEWEFSVSFVSLIFLLYACYKLIGAGLKGGWIPWRLGRTGWLNLTAIGTILLIPVLLNVYWPSWNAFLKSLPIIQSSSTLFRWFILYIPSVILATALILEKFVPGKYRAGVCIVSLVCCVATKASHHNLYYAGEPYNPQTILDSYRAVKSGAHTPEITAMGAYVDNHGTFLRPLDRNDSFTRGISQIFAYESLFGYNLEYLPIKTLHPGPALETTAGVLNVKNPASYVWPLENQCLPGDHFKVEQKASAEAFLKYKPFPFRIPLIQKFANWTNLGVLIAVLVFQMGFLCKMISGLFSAKPKFPSTTPNPSGRSPKATGGLQGGRATGDLVSSML